jgi:hypothetical protein
MDYLPKRLVTKVVCKSTLQTWLQRGLHAAMQQNTSHPYSTARLPMSYLATLVLPAGAIVMSEATPWRDAGSPCSKRFLRDPTLLSSTLAIWPRITSHRLGSRQRPLGLFAGWSLATTRKKSPCKGLGVGRKVHSEKRARGHKPYPTWSVGVGASISASTELGRESYLSLLLTNG